MIDLTTSKIRVARLCRDPNDPANERWVELRQPHVDLEPDMKTLFSRFVKDKSGATAIGFGLIAAGISVAIIAVVDGLGSKLNATFSSVSTQLK